MQDTYTDSCSIFRVVSRGILSKKKENSGKKLKTKKGRERKKGRKKGNIVHANTVAFHRIISSRSLRSSTSKTNDLSTVPLPAIIH